MKRESMEFPDLGNISMRDYLEILQADGRLTRSCKRTLVQPLPPSQVPQKRSNSQRKKRSGTKKAKKEEPLVPPSPQEDRLRVRFLEGCVFGPDALSRELWSRSGSDWTLLGVLTDFEPPTGEDTVPAVYKANDTWVSFSDHEELWLAGDLVSYQNQPWTLMWPFQKPSHFPNVTIYREGKIEHLGWLELSEYPEFCPQKENYATWRADRKVDPIEDFSEVCLRFVKVQKQKSKFLILRVHPDSGKIFVYKNKEFKWITCDKHVFTCRRSEPPVPLSLLAEFTPGSDLRKQYEQFFGKNHLALATPKDEGADQHTNHRLKRCKVCNFIIDDLQFRVCSSCETVYHCQCLEAPLDQPTLRGSWRCRDCPRCENCLGCTGNFLRCVSCNGVFHEKCLDSSLTPPPASRWKCERCAVCEHCKVQATAGGIKWNKDLTKCLDCDAKWRKGEFCPICLGFWFVRKGRQSRSELRLGTQDNRDMVECGRCNKWVHISCDDSINNELRHLLTTNETIKYYCPDCKQKSRNNELHQLVVDLMKLDVNHYFAKEVIDPYYNRVIKNQMYFEKMMDRALEGVYSSDFEALVSDFKLICENAMCFCKGNSPGYQAAEALLAQGMDILQQRAPPSKRPRPRTAATPQTKKHRKLAALLARPLPDLRLSLPTPIELQIPHTHQLDEEAFVPSPGLNFTPPVSFLNVVIRKKDIQPYLSAGAVPSYYPTPISIVYTDPQLCLAELCYLCCSFISPSEECLCHCCGRAFHTYCADDSTTKQVKFANPTSPVNFTNSVNHSSAANLSNLSNQSNTPNVVNLVNPVNCSNLANFANPETLTHSVNSANPANSDNQIRTPKIAWRCKDCRVCEICLSSQDANLLIYCNSCEKAFHPNCLWPGCGNIQPSTWTCDKCFECSQCGSRTPGVRESPPTDFSLCEECSEATSNRNVCPVCHVAFQEEDEKIHCKFCECYFHVDCAKDSRGFCPMCLTNAHDYALLEKATLEKVQLLLGLISQSKVYKFLAEECIQKRFSLPTDFAKEISNFFIADNAVFLTESKEMKNLFLGRGIDIVRKTPLAKPEYRLTRVPTLSGMRRSEIIMPATPCIVNYTPSEVLPIWTSKWDTSMVIWDLSKLPSITDPIYGVQKQIAKPFQNSALLVMDPFITWNFESLPLFLDLGLTKLPDHDIYLNPGWVDLEFSSSDESSMEELEEEEVKPENSKASISTAEVLVNELSAEELLKIQIDQELPAVIAFCRKFEEWLAENILKLTLHYLNISSKEIAETPIESPIEDVQIPHDFTDSLECVFCKLPGERSICGRLLPTEEGLWVHTSCVYWSHEVKEDQFGLLYNFKQKLSRTKGTKCRRCGLSEATIACCGKKCPLVYHFPCSLGIFHFFENKTTFCSKCVKEPSRRLSTRALAAKARQKYFISKGKKFSKKPTFTSYSFNRIGSAILCEIPDESNNQRLLVYRRGFYQGRRVLFKAEHTDGLFRISIAQDTNDPSPVVIGEDSDIEKLWPIVKVGESFALKSAADFFGYSLLNHFLPPMPLYEVNKERKAKPVGEIIKDLQPSLYGASWLAPFKEHLKSPKMTGSASINHKTVNFEDSHIQELKSENALAADFRKYKKTPGKDDRLEVLPSSIHGLGLFTKVGIPPGNIVIEYIGEIIRNKVADIREKEYEEKGIGDGSCYMFRLDPYYVVDATCKGGKARFINHSCQNNCEATICEIDGEKHILLFSKRSIMKGEEITYDYNFEVEREKILCTCGAKDCQVRLN